jgi:hypothetical protein
MEQTCKVQRSSNDRVTLGHLGPCRMSSDHDLLHVWEIDRIREPLDNLIQRFVRRDRLLVSRVHILRTGEPVKCYKCLLVPVIGISSPYAQGQTSAFVVLRKLNISDMLFVSDERTYRSSIDEGVCFVCILLIGTRANVSI